MKKTRFLFSRFLGWLVPVIVLGGLFGANSIQPARADAAPPPEPAIGGAGPYRPQKTNVQMMAETVLIEFSGQPPKPDQGAPIRQSASFTMRNQGQTGEKMQVIFPLTQLSADRDEQSDYQVDLASFVTRVDGRTVPITEIDTPAEPGYQLEFEGNSASPTDGFLPDVRWAAFDVTFPVHKNVVIQVAYNMVTFPEVEFTTINYILETGAGWYGNILSADITVRLPYPATRETILGANPQYILEGNDLRWHLADFEPTRADNLSVRVIPSRTWHNILALRARAAQNPGNADAWNALGNAYLPLAIPANFSNGLSEYRTGNNFFIDLGVRAYQRALALRPHWGNPHFKIANLTWAKNEARPDLQLEDPAIQTVLNELDIAWRYGNTEVGSAAYLLKSINATIPGVELSLRPLPGRPVTPFPTVQPGAQTPASKISDNRGVNMLLVPAGKFIMGSDASIRPNQNPAHSVYLDAYYIDQYEVTIAEYQACVEAGTCVPPPDPDSTSFPDLPYPDYYHNPGFDNYPVVGPWEMARTYCDWRGNGTRLPTEAEWEKASRGTDGRAYPWGAAEKYAVRDESMSTRANYGYNSGAPLPVGSFQSDKSVYGVYDTAGNVSEWVQDWYSDTYYQGSPTSNPMGPDTGTYRSIRGGSWDEFTDNSNSAYRVGLNLLYRYGFRCARPLTPATRGQPLQTPAATIEPTVTAATPTRQNVLTTNRISDENGVSMLRVPAGSFGSAEGRQIYLDSFDIDAYEVTNAAYSDCVKAGACLPPKQTYSYTRSSYYGNPDFDNYPVIDVDWNMARNYCELWRDARLPVDAEWEKTAGVPAAGPDAGQPYPWGQGIDEAHANYNQKLGDTTPVGSYEAGRSPYGAYDMAGNVWEWVADVAMFADASSKQGNPLVTDPYRFADNPWRWIRGGSWFNSAPAVRSGYRNRAQSTYASLLIGFRCARSIAPSQGDRSANQNKKAAAPFVDKKGVPMLRVPAGGFSMGSENGDSNEKPVHQVSLDTYAIDQYEVTNARYQACVMLGACPKHYAKPGLDHHPVVQVNWNTAMRYCEWRGARLPSEAEWEKAARGSDGRSYPWGEGIDRSFANFNRDETTPVGSYEKGKSVYGVYDMAGNVWEWVNDWYDEAYYQSSPPANPLGPVDGKYHVLRGGSWYLPDFGERSSFRSYGTPEYYGPTVGFRCARSIP